MIWTWQRRRRK